MPQFLGGVVGTTAVVNSHRRKALILPVGVDELTLGQLDRALRDTEFGLAPISREEVLARVASIEERAIVVLEWSVDEEAQLTAPRRPHLCLRSAPRGSAISRARRCASTERDKIEDILISLTGQYHLIRMVGTTMFTYTVLDRQRANLAMSRKMMEQIEKGLDVDRA